MDQHITGVNASATIKKWVELYFDSLYSWAVYKTSNKTAAEDLVQETFLAAFKSFDKFAGKSDAKTWLFAILRNKVTDYHRKQYKDPGARAEYQSQNASDALFGTLFNEHEEWQAAEQPEVWDADSGNLLDDPEFNSILQRCLKNLPTTWFSAIQLKFMEEKKPEIVCQELGVNATNYWQIIHRAKLQLRKCIQLNWFNT